MWSLMQMGEITEEMIRENPEEWERLKGIMKEMAKILKERKSGVL